AGDGPRAVAAVVRQVGAAGPGQGRAGAVAVGQHGTVPAAERGLAQQPHRAALHRAGPGDGARPAGRTRRRRAARRRHGRARPAAVRAAGRHAAAGAGRRRIVEVPAMNVLVVGGSGYLGSGIASACQRGGARVRVVSRRGTAPFGDGLCGDARLPRLGLSGEALARVRAETTHAVLSFGPVAWTSSPGEAMETHASGIRSTLAFLRELPALEQAVHVSSLLALGRAEGR